MAARRGTGTRAETIHCDICGEDYAVTYKRCPFCNGRAPAEDGGDDGRRGSGRRVSSNTRGGGYGGGVSPLKVIGTVISLALIVAAVCIVISVIKPLVDRGDTEMVNPDSPPPSTESPAPGPGSSSGGSGTAGNPGTPETGAPTPDSSADPGAETDPPVESIPASQTATSFTLNQSDFTINDSYPLPVTIRVSFIPEGTTGAISWSSSDPEVIAVDANGTVSAGSKNGSATITASMPGAPDQTCTVRNGVTTPVIATPSGGSESSGGGESSGSGDSGGETTPGGGALSLNHTDFTFSSMEDPVVYMRVNGTSSTPTWSIGNTSVASISAEGVVRPVGRGTTTITCTVDGQTLECIVRCNFRD